MRTLVVGSRASHLAKAQVKEFLTPLRERFPEIEFRHQVILEGGDRDRRTALSTVSARSGGSAFSAEQEAALVRGEADVIVHSLKDLPPGNPPGLVLLPSPGSEDVPAELCGGCSVPIDAYAKASDGVLALHAQVTFLDGTKQVEADFPGPVSEPEKLGVLVAGLLLDQGAEGALAEIRPAS
ncbi:hypothetical protein [Kitasatospora sp. NPDC088351]|uniref:hypothetical protein n=1 Tax=Kitasatospora sp. NPDC088351 TaxID=3155180 RepID=UPI00343A2977